MRSLLSRRAVVSVGFFSLALLVGCAKPSAGRPEVPPAPVITAVAQKKTMLIQTRAIGAVKAISTYSVRPRVNGELTEAHFHEGEDVKKGQKLFTIDPRPYETAFKRADATLAKNKAVLAGAELDLERAERASRTGVGSREELDTARTAVASAKATVAADEATLQSARLQLSFTTIISPIEGRTGGLLVTPGNLVSTTDVTPLVIVNQISPIDVAFALPEQLLPQVDAARQRGPLPVTAHLRNGTGDAPVSGVLSFIDNAVDSTTGTVQLKAQFKNDDRKLWPGQFVDVVLTTGERPNSVVVPLAAVQSGQKGQYVFVIAGLKAELREVTVAFEDAGMAVIASGLKGGEQVVVEGQLRLIQGSKVEVKGTLGEPKADGSKVAVSPPAPAVQLVEGAAR